MSDVGAGTIPNCGLCGHRFHGLPCPICACETAFKDKFSDEDL